MLYKYNLNSTSHYIIAHSYSRICLFNRENIVYIEKKPHTTMTKKKFNHVLGGKSKIKAIQISRIITGETYFKASVTWYIQLTVKTTVINKHF